MIEVVQAEPKHIIDICTRLRDLENDSFKKLGVDPEHFMMQEYSQSLMNWAGTVNGETAVIAGIKSGPFSAEGYLWLLGSQLMYDWPMAFLRYSKKHIETIRPLFPVLYGCVLTDYAVSIRWLRWLGFEMCEPEDKYRRFILK